MGRIATFLWQNLEKYACILGFSIMTIITFVNVLSRYFFNMSLSFMEALTINLFVWVTLFGSALAARRGAHLGLSVLTDRYFRLRKFSIVLTAVCSTFLYGLIGWYGYELVRSQMTRGQISSALRIPEWILTTAIPVGCIVIVIRFLEMTYRQWQKEVKA